MPVPPRPVVADLTPPGTGPASSTAANHASNGAASTASAHPAAAASSPAWHATLPGLSASVPVARSLVRAALPGCPRADDLALAVTELTCRERTLLSFGRWSSSGIVAGASLLSGGDRA